MRVLLRYHNLSFPSLKNTFPKVNTHSLAYVVAVIIIIIIIIIIITSIIALVLYSLFLSSKGACPLLSTLICDGSTASSSRLS
jgi:flagellar basal body-associated protein FliL